MAGIKNQYNKERVRKMSLERSTKMPPKNYPFDADIYRQALGNLLAAGHLKINGFESMQVETERGSGHIPDKVYLNRKMGFRSVIQHNGAGEAPHLVGYLESGNSIDKRYKIKGWFNEDGTIRIELVN
jgi:hypothetical protein